MKNNLKEFYPYYLSLHQNKYCRRLHFLGQIVTLWYLFFVLLMGWYVLLLFLPFVIYPFAWSGHFFFEKNKPAAFSQPIYSKISDWMMFRDILIGRIKW